MSDEEKKQNDENMEFSSDEVFALLVVPVRQTIQFSKTKEKRFSFFIIID